MPFEPMLATNRVSRPLTGEWVLEPKFDGWRTIVAVGEDVRVWTRTGHELTDRLPELAPLALAPCAASLKHPADRNPTTWNGPLNTSVGRGARTSATRATTFRCQAWRLDGCNYCRFSTYVDGDSGQRAL
jgi:hypothetical protein